MSNLTKCKVIIFSDVHYAPEPPNIGTASKNRKLMQYSVPMINKLIDKINNSIHPDAVINLGDLIEDFMDHDKDVVNLNFIWNILKNIKPKFYSLAGNHDLRCVSREEVEQIMGYEHSTFSSDINGYHLVFLGLNVKSEIGTAEGGIIRTRNISNEDLEWLKKDLNANTLPCILFNHFGIAEDDMEGNWWFEKKPNSALLENRKDLKNILECDKNILGVFSGHQHWTKQLKEGGINYYMLGSLTENIHNDGIPDGVYFEVDLENDKMQVIEHHLQMENLKEKE